MEEQAPNYTAEFLKSPHHAVLGVLTLGLGFLSAQILGLIAGATLYTLGWIYLPGLPLFRRWVDRKKELERKSEEARRVADFIGKREALLRSLAGSRRERYTRLSFVCRDIEKASADNLLADANAASDPRLRKLDELMWTFLRLLGIEESLERYLETEQRENLPGVLKEAEAEVAKLKAELETLKKQGAPGVDSRQRFLSSREERLEVLRRRQSRTEQAESNMALVRSEQERLEEQIKLIRADAVATKNAETLTARIDATVEHLDQTNKWLSELDEFKDLVGDMPSTQFRVGYESAPTMPSAAPAPSPPVIDPAQRTKPQPWRQRQAQ
jgi:hypothetical protein